MYIFFEEEYFAKNMDEPPTKEEVDNFIRRAWEPFPQGLPQEKLDEWVDAMGKTTLDIFTHKNRREKFKTQLRRVVDLIDSKLPLPNKENQAKWGNMCAAIEAIVNASQRVNGDGREKLRKARARFPFLNL
jgi:hypothetical protein